MTFPRGTSDGDHVRTIRWSDVGRLLLRGAGFALLVTTIAVVTAVVITRASDPVYRASVSLVASQSPPRFEAVDVIAPPAVDPGVYRTALFEGDVLKAAFERVEGRPIGQVALERLTEKVRVTLETQQVSSIVRIDVRDASPQRAADVANAIAEELVAWDQDRARQGLAQGIAALERAIEAIDLELARDGTRSDARRATLLALREEREQELAGARDAVASAVAIGLIEPLRVAEPPERAIGPRLVLNVAIAGVLGLVLGYGIVVITWTANPRITTREDLERLGQLPVFATFPRRRPGAPRLSSEASSMVRTRVSVQRNPGSALIVVVVGLRSTSDQDGVAVGLAESFARIGEETLLVDANLRHARATAWLEVSPAQPTPYDDASLARDDAVTAPMSVIVDATRSFDFLPAFAGADQPVDRLVRVFRAHVPVWSSRYDVIVVDAAPAFPHPDVLGVADVATAVILCARSSHATLRDLNEAIGMLREQGAPLLGTVLTGASRRPGEVAARPAAVQSRPASTTATSTGRNTKRRA